MTAEKVRDTARGSAPVTVTGEGLDRPRRARDAVHAAMERQPVYGRTTGVGANRSIRVRDGGHGLRLLPRHAGGAGALPAAPVARGMLVGRRNQLAAGGSGGDP